MDWNNIKILIKNILLVIVCFFLQTAFFPFVTTSPVVVDLILLVSICFTMQLDVKYGLITAFVGGMFVDILTTFPVGFGAISRFIAIVLIRPFQNNTYTRLIMVMGVTIVATVVKEVSMALFYNSIGMMKTFEIITVQTLLKLTVNAIGMPFVYGAVLLLNKNEKNNHR